MRTGYTEEDRGHSSACWVWAGSLNAKGYGRAWGGPAHRVFYERLVGAVPEGMELDHLCRVRECVNPEHLEVVTHAENTRRGAAARDAVCDSELARWIRDGRRTAHLSQSELGCRLGVSQGLIAHWERGHCEPPAHRLLQLRRELAEGRDPVPDGPVIGARG